MKPPYIRTATKVGYASRDIIGTHLRFTRAMSRKNRNVYSRTKNEKDGERRIEKSGSYRHIIFNITSTQINILKDGCFLANPLSIRSCFSREIKISSSISFFNENILQKSRSECVFFLNIYRFFTTRLYGARLFC